MVDAGVLKQIDERIQELDEEIQELALDGLNIPKITPEIKSKLDKVSDLIGLSFNACGLESLDNLPNGAGLVRLELKENKFKAAELPKIADKYAKLQILMLSDNNTITDYAELKPLTKLKEIMQLELNNTPLSKKPDYRPKLFEMFPALEILDDLDKNGEPYEFDDDEEGEDYDDDEEEGSDYEEDDDEEEYTAKGSSRKKNKK